MTEDGAEIRERQHRDVTSV